MAQGPVRAGLDGSASDALLKLGRFFSKWEETDDGRAVFREGGRSGDIFYRDRWSHDKVVRSTHGVNCTGSCSWKVYVKDGIITWESQQTDYPSVGPDSPNMNRAAVRAERPFPGTPIPQPGSATRTDAVCSSRCTVRRRPG